MDNLKSLMEKRNYDLVLKITDNSKDTDELFYRISAFTALGKLEEALNVIKENRKILETKLDLLIKVHFQLLYLLNKFDEARDEVDNYYLLPYYSQAVEEKLKELPKEIAAKEKESYMITNHVKFIDDILLNPKDPQDVISAIELIKDEDLFKYCLKLQNVLSSDISREVKNYVVFRMIKAEVNYKFLYKINDNEIVELNPIKTKSPFASEIFSEIMTRIDKINKNPVLQKNMLDILMIYVTNLFPYEISGEPNTIYYSVKLIAYDLLKLDNNEVLDEIESSETPLVKVIEYENKIKEFL